MPTVKLMDLAVTCHFVQIFVNHPRPISSQHILYQIVQGVSNAAVLDVFVATLKTGVRTIDPDTGIIYLMIDGHLRQVPDATTYANLFKDPQSSLLPSSATAFPVGPPLTNGAHLAKAQLTPEAAARVPMPHDPYPFLGNGQVYFIVDGKKHKITSGPAFDSFGFNSAKIQQVAPQLINALPVGPDI